MHDFLKVPEFIIYALCDPRTHTVRYIGMSEKGLLRPLSHKDCAENRGVSAWILDLKATGHEYTVLILARATNAEELRMLEARWIATGLHFGWPLANRQIPTYGGNMLEKEIVPLDPGKRWNVKAWRRDPEVRERLTAAKRKNKPKSE